MLQLLGLSAHAETVYRTTLQYPDHGVAALSKDTGLTEAEIRAAFDELAALALLKPSDQFGGRLRPVSPEVGLSTLLASTEAELAGRQAQVETTRAAIAAIAAEHRSNRLSDSAIRLQGLDAVRARLEELQRTTEFECLSLNPGGAHRPDARSAATPLNEQALRRGVTIRAVCRESFRNDPDTLAYAHWLIEHGGELRTVPTVPIQMVIVDRRIAILPLDPSAPRSGALEIQSPGVMAALCALFEQCWATGTSFGEQPPADDNGCTPVERTLLRIIASGDTDESAARKLGVSLRTVRRMMSHLMERLEAASRFQAGVNAARRGWL
ncbi:DNA-binding CsgD family transcriptional regulator [Streptomyces sp. V4I23]|uniref:helix-turn-helix transcriptional regulator n=1 Tax=Streptomyces sp. V4I23 TaxID=3042282 RepID=UPI0027826485|nr:LuxR C-terminal-related transcriptional regulator [Streptomyces sp. V4I23]MDQ1005746.1 DNA-binding CsgD family transcriptional regulator [Streptomyces sp. V4I23]MDQ1006004.1 DNA-binding CsgD family transcriptional regulator [Streptomyces sp. V4I23]MDQ1013366.1 DNA-binding CsgD family transcriptional regulator [Streptomyces sp. V4I23]